MTYGTPLYMLARAGLILSCASMHLGCQVPADWRYFHTIKLGKSRYRLYWVESTINQTQIKTQLWYKHLVTYINFWWYQWNQNSKSYFNLCLYICWYQKVLWFFSFGVKTIIFLVRGTAEFFFFYKNIF